MELLLLFSGVSGTMLIGGFVVGVGLCMGIGLVLVSTAGLLRIEVDSCCGSSLPDDVFNVTPVDGGMVVEEEFDSFLKIEIS